VKAGPESHAAAVRPALGGLERLERGLVVLIAVHSIVVGLILVLVPAWGARTGGFGAVQPLFFPRQAGIFHFVAATAYLLEYFRYRGVLLLVVTKCVAVVFLLTTSAVDSVPWVVPLSGIADGLMGLAVALVRRARGRRLTGPCLRGME
jgi:hypothetical protein